MYRDHLPVTVSDAKPYRFLTRHRHDTYRIDKAGRKRKIPGNSAVSWFCCKFLFGLAEEWRPWAKKAASVAHLSGKRSWGDPGARYFLASTQCDVSCANRSSKKTLGPSITVNQCYEQRWCLRLMPPSVHSEVAKTFQRKPGGGTTLTGFATSGGSRKPPEVAPSGRYCAIRCVTSGGTGETGGGGDGSTSLVAFPAAMKTELLRVCPDVPMLLDLPGSVSGVSCRLHMV